ncbi:hypothetical protein BH11PSE2_BH11PSE2_09560 [soil metagenome]
MIRRRIDRARLMRARRQWWDRHGPYCLGVATGVGLSLLGFAIAHFVLAYLASQGAPLIGK